MANLCYAAGNKYIFNTNYHGLPTNLFINHFHLYSLNYFFTITKFGHEIRFSSPNVWLFAIFTLPLQRLTTSKALG